MIFSPLRRLDKKYHLASKILNPDKQSDKKLLREHRKPTKKAVQFSTPKPQTTNFWMQLLTFFHLS